LDSTQFVLLYSAPAHPPLLLWVLGALGVVILLAGRARWRSAKAADATGLVSALVTPGIIVFAGAVMTLLCLVIPATVWGFLSVRLLTGRYTRVQGTVAAFIPGDGHRPESWSVTSNGRTYHYAYNPSEPTGGYDRLASPSGPLGDGAEVRIADVGGRIARLEVARPPQ
jgi:hypothetical protein